MTTLQLPHAKEVEISILSAMMNDLDSLNLACEEMTFEDFFLTANQAMFQAMKDLYLKDSKVDSNTLFDELKISGNLQKAGSVEYIVQVKHCYDMTLHLEQNIRILKDKSLLRKAIFLGRSMMTEAASGPANIKKFIESFEKQFHEMEKGRTRYVSRTVGEILNGACNSESKTFLQKAQERQEMAQIGSKPFKGYPTHYLDLDAKIPGLSKGHFTIIGARPGVGKTSFMLNIAINMGLINDLTVGIFSLEMPGDELATKILCTYADIDQEKLESGNFRGDFYQQLVVANDKLQRAKVHIEEQPALTISQIRSRARRWKEVNGVQIIFIDYIQLVRGGAKFESKQYEVGEISQQMKILAKDLDMPIVCLAQLNRESEKRTNKEPMLSDLRESGQLEQDADEVLLLSRPDMAVEKDGHSNPVNHEVMSIYIAKNRFGATGKVDLTFSRKSGKLFNMSKEKYE